LRDGTGIEPRVEPKQRIWAHFDVLTPEQVHSAFRAALQHYFARLDARCRPIAGLKEVETFLGTRSVQDMLTLRLHAVALHTWDVLVARAARRGSPPAWWSCCGPSSCNSAPCALPRCWPASGYGSARLRCVVYATRVPISG
jgi:hypothetical protein